LGLRLEAWLALLLGVGLEVWLGSE